MAYYHAKPKGKDESRITTLRKFDEGLDISLPKCDADYLVPLFFEAGMYEASFGGVSPLSWSEIKSWLEVTGRDLTVFEADCIKEMSVGYCNEYTSASEEHARPPYIEFVELTEKEIEVKATSLKDSLMALSQRQ